MLKKLKLAISGEPDCFLSLFIISSSEKFTAKFVLKQLLCNEEFTVDVQDFCLTPFSISIVLMNVGCQEFCHTSNYSVDVIFRRIHNKL